MEQADQQWILSVQPWASLQKYWGIWNFSSLSWTEGWLMEGRIIYHPRSLIYRALPSPHVKYRSHGGRGCSFGAHILRWQKGRKKQKESFCFPVAAAHHLVRVVPLVTSGSDVQSWTFREGTVCWPQRMFNQFSLEWRWWYCWPPILLLSLLMIHFLVKKKTTLKHHKTYVYKMYIVNSIVSELICSYSK